MAMTREEMQKLASYGRDGDTMLAHINPEEAALLKSRGGSGTINPNTGLPEFKFSLKNITGGVKALVKNPGKAIQEVTAPIVEPLEKAGGQITSNLANLPGSIENTVKQVAANPIAQIALAFYMPTIAASLGPYLTAVPAAYQTAVASALANTAVQVAQGVPFEDALKSATVNAVTSTGAPSAATYVESLGANKQVADALTSVGASAAKTAAMGGTKDDIEKNMVASLTGSGLSSALQSADVSRDTSRVAGAAAGGAVTGGTTGAVGGAISELGSQAARDEAARAKALENAKKGIASADTSTAFDTGQQLPENIVVGKREPDPTLQDTSVILSDGTVKAKTPSTAPATPQAVTDTSPVAQEKPAEPGKPPVDEQGVYKPNLFIYGGQSPSTLGSSLKTQAPFYPLAGTSGGLTSTRGAGELESKETGKPRKNVWNEESLRLKDALGV